MLITHFNPEYIKAKKWANDYGSNCVATVGVKPNGYIYRLPLASTLIQ